MVTIKIGENERNIHDSELQRWVNQQLDIRQKESVPVCVQVQISHDNAKMGLSSAVCTGNGGGGRPPNKLENEIFNLWNHHGLNSKMFPGGSLIAFLQRLKKLLNI